MSRPNRAVLRCLLLTALALSAGTRAAEDSAWDDHGPFFSRFRLTLAPGERTEAAGPFWFRQQSGAETQFGVPPLFSVLDDPLMDRRLVDVAYPLLTYKGSGEEFRWQFLQLLSWSGGETQSGDTTKRVTVYPFFFRQKSAGGTNDYLAVLPFHGEVRNRFNRDEVGWTLWPLWVWSRKRDVVTHNFPYPLIHTRRGDALSGWQFLPFAGHETKGPTWRTNVVDEPELVPGHEKGFVLWPLFLWQNVAPGTTNESRFKAFLPFYATQTSPARDWRTYGWPIGFSVAEDRARGYREIGAPWPFIGWATGEGKQGFRVWPFYGDFRSPTQQSEFVLWPLYGRREARLGPVDRERVRWLFFLYSDITETERATGKQLRRRNDFWPLWTARTAENGSRRVQVLAPLEPLLPRNDAVERNWSPLWSVWRAETNAVTRMGTRSLLWNLYRCERTPETLKRSVLFGLFQQQKTPAGKRWRVLFIPFGRKAASAGGNE